MTSRAGRALEGRMQQLTDEWLRGPLNRKMAEMCKKAGARGMSLDLTGTRQPEVGMTVELEELLRAAASKFRAGLSAAGLSAADLDFAYLLFDCPEEQELCGELTLRAASNGRLVVEALGTVREYPEISATLAGQLTRIDPTEGFRYPCAATLRDGRLLERVYLAEARSWYLRIGMWPDQQHLQVVPLAEIDRLEESRWRLPARFAEQVYAAGESAMGMIRFAVHFADGGRSIYSHGSAGIDFIDYPPGLGGADVAGIVPHASGTPREHRRSPDHSVCLFAAPD